MGKFMMRGNEGAGGFATGICWGRPYDEVANALIVVSKGVHGFSLWSIHMFEVQKGHWFGETLVVPSPSILEGH